MRVSVTCCSIQIHHIHHISVWCICKLKQIHHIGPIQIETDVVSREGQAIWSPVRKIGRRYNSETRLESKNRNINLSQNSTQKSKLELERYWLRLEGLTTIVGSQFRCLELPEPKFKKLIEAWYSASSILVLFCEIRLDIPALQGSGSAQDPIKQARGSKNGPTPALDETMRREWHCCQISTTLLLQF